ncbi:MAG: hypothetical protein KDE11_03040 [Rhodobacteraceae bacterium]|nr:hypothetical protein [Paracoccaceae bacterium]
MSSCEQGSGICAHKALCEKVDQSSIARPKKKFKRYPIAHFHIDIAEVPAREGKIRLFVTVGRPLRFADVALHERAGKMLAAQFLRKRNGSFQYQSNPSQAGNEQRIAPMKICSFDPK